MTIRLLGTGGADGVPAMWGKDRVSVHARKAGGKEIRTRSAAIIDDGLKIDLGPDTYHQMTRERLDPRDWTALLFTHSDDDHLCVSELQYALFPFVTNDALPFTIYGNAAVLGIIRDRYPNWPMELVETQSFRCFRHGAYDVTPVKARHSAGEDCQNLLVERDGKRILYATDTGVWPHETFARLAGTRLDILVIECTDGFRKGTYQGHLDIEAMLGIVEGLRRVGTLDDRSQIVTTHHAASGDGTYAELRAHLGRRGIIAGYDGICLTC